MALASLIVFQMQIVDRTTLKDEAMSYLSVSELNIRARKKTLKSKFDSQIEFLNKEDRLRFLRGGERHSPWTC
jgi:hypothetical protein